MHSETLLSNCFYVRSSLLDVIQKLTKLPSDRLNTKDLLARSYIFLISVSSVLLGFSLHGGQHSFIGAQ